MTERLLPCPFCGSHPRHMRAHYGSNGYCVKCSRCPAEIWLGQQPTNSIAAWNRRTTAPDVSRLLAAAKEYFRLTGSPASNDVDLMRAMIELRASIAEFEEGAGR